MAKTWGVYCLAAEFYGQGPRYLCETRAEARTLAKQADRECQTPGTRHTVRRIWHAPKAKPPKMKSLGDAVDDPSMTLKQWLFLVKDLIKTHGEDAVMFTDGGYNNVTLRLERRVE